MSFNSEVIRELKSVAETTNQDFEVVAAVAHVESAGIAFWTIDGKKVPPIRFEGHYFYRILKKKSASLLKQAVREGLASPKAGAVRNPKSWAARYTLFSRAYKIDPQAAIESTSWGLGQVMGAHWKKLGFHSAETFMKFNMEGVKQQLLCMMKYIKVFGLMDEMRNRDWAGFAYGYNGPAYAKWGYDTKLAKAYKMFSKNVPIANAFIVDLEDKLYALGYLEKKFKDGVEDIRTTDAVKKFQRDNGLVADGLAGPMTLETLDEVLENQKSEKARTRIKQVGVGTAVIAPQTDTIIKGVKKATDTTENVKSLLDLINVNTLLMSVILGCVVAYILYKEVFKVKSDRVRSSTNKDTTYELDFADDPINSVFEGDEDDQLNFDLDRV